MSLLIKRKYGVFTLNNNELKKQLKRNNISPYDITEVKKYIVDYVSHDISFLNFFIKRMKDDGFFSYTLCYTPTVNDTSELIKIDEDLIIKKINTISERSLFFKLFINKINYYNSNEYFFNTTLKKPINKNVTYMDLINLLRSDGDELAKLIKCDNFCGLTGNELLEVLSSKSLFDGGVNRGFFERLLSSSKLNLSEEEKDRINKNKSLLFYAYEEDKSDIKSFFSDGILAEQFVLTKELENDILGELPEDFNLTQKAYYIYKRICQKFSYDPEFYYLLAHKRSSESKIDHRDINRLSTIKGGEEVICLESSLLFAKFLEKLNVPFVLLNYRNEKVFTTDASHIKVRFMSDGYLIDADLAHGLTQSDMVYEKILGRTGQFQCINTPQRIQDSFGKEKNVVDEYFDENITEFNDAKEIYQSLYQRENIELNFEDKMNMFINIIQTQKLEFFDMIHFLSKVKKRLFKREKQNIFVEFIVHKNEEKTNLEILLGYNLDKSIMDNLSENQYLIINSMREVEEIDYNSLKEKFDNGTYDFTAENRNFFKLEEEENQNESQSFRTRNK